MPNSAIAFLFLFIMLAFSSCRSRNEERSTSMSVVFEKKSSANGEHYDLEQIRKGGELIVATLSGPDTYYDYHGIGMGLQYALAENFAAEQGLVVRMEVGKDTTALLDLLESGKADLIAYPLQAGTVKENHFVAAGYDEGGTWSVRDDAPELAKALKAWYHKGLKDEVTKSEAQRLAQSRHVTRKARSVFLSRERGVISIYDNLFKSAQGITGWDWRLLAAQCYQESAFDPNARSYVGAQGLMQLMPATARELGLKPEEVFLPERNVDAAARYIARLSQAFSDIRQPEERIKFVLASYNGGSFHIRDAMALARKYGHDTQRWEEVAPYVLALQQRKFFTDSVVKNGYMIGSETVNYVQNILQRWHDYGGRVAITHAPVLPPEAHQDRQAANPGGNARKSLKPRSRFATGVRVLTPEELQAASAAQ